jgi:glycosyltransferase involved in cell wall biosynthesis
MRVLINALATVGPRTGVGHYVHELVRCLVERVGPDGVVCFPRGWVGRARRVTARLRDWLKQHLPRPAWVESLLRWHFRAGYRGEQFDVYHEPNFIPLPSDLPTVVTIHDLSAVLHPQWHPADRVARFERHFRAGLARGDHFLAISEFGRQEIIHALGVPPAKVTRTYMGVRRGLAPLPADRVRAGLARLKLPPRYLLYLGTIEPRKNVLTLLRAYCALPPDVRGRYPLVLAGGWGWDSREVARYLHDEARHRGVLSLGYVDERHLPVLYNGARALVFPSLYEGFGLPPVEMLACGGAVLAGTAGAVAETVGRQAHLVEPLDADGWRSALWRVATDDDWWHQLRRGAVEAARPFTWEQCASDTLGVYESVAARRRQRAA